MLSSEVIWHSTYLMIEEFLMRTLFLRDHEKPPVIRR